MSWLRRGLNSNSGETDGRKWRRKLNSCSRDHKDSRSGNGWIRNIFKAYHTSVVGETDGRTKRRRLNS